MRKISALTIGVIVSLFGVIEPVYAGLEDSGKWLPMGNGNWALEQGNLSVQTEQQEFYITRKVDFADKFTLSLKAKTVSPEDNDIIVLFCDGHYKLVLGGWRNAKIGLYKSNRHFAGEWIAMREDNRFRVTPDKWYNIEILKDNEYITVLLDQKEVFRAIDLNYCRGEWIGVGTYKSHVHFDGIEVSERKGLLKAPPGVQALYPSGTVTGTCMLTHMFITEKALSNYSIPEDDISYYKSRIIDGSRDEDLEGKLNPKDHFYNPATGQGFPSILTVSALKKAEDVWDIGWAGKITDVIPSLTAEYKAGRKWNAYWILGRVAHLLGDMASPAHTHLIDHRTVKDLYETYCDETYSSDGYTTDGIVTYGSLQDFFYNTALLSYGSATETINGVTAFTVNDIVNNTYGRPKQGENEGAYINNQSYLTDVRKETLAKYLVPAAIQRTAGLFEYFGKEKEKMQITPDYITVESRKWEDQDGTMEIDQDGVLWLLTVGDKVEHKVDIKNLGDATDVTIRILIQYKDSSGNAHDLGEATQTTISINPGEIGTVSCCPSEQIPMQARSLCATYFLTYEGITKTFSSADESIGYIGVESTGAEQLQATIYPAELSYNSLSSGISVAFTVKGADGTTPVENAKILLNSSAFGTETRSTDSNGEANFYLYFSSNIEEGDGEISYEIDATEIGNYRKIYGESIRVYDYKPPIISEVTAFDIDYDRAKIKWKTDELTTSIVEYGITTDYGQTNTEYAYLWGTENELGFDRLYLNQLELVGLQLSTTYHYRVVSTDTRMPTQSTDYTFTTCGESNPIVRVISPNGGEVWKGTQTIKWEATDTGGWPLTIYIEIIADSGAAWCLAENEANDGVYSFNTTDMNDGNYKVIIHAYSKYANNGSESDNNFTIDNTTPPDTFILSGPTGKINVGSVTFEYTGTDTITPASGLQYSYKLDDALWSVWTSTTKVAYSKLSDGTHTFSVKARDEAGNIDTSPATRTFVVVVPPPVIPVGLTYSLTLNTVSLSWISNKEYGFTYYNIYRNGTKVGSTTTPSYANSNLGRGTFTYTVTAVNKEGKESGHSQPVVVSIISISISGRVIDINTGSPIQGVKVIAYQEQQVKGTAYTDSQGCYCISNLLSLDGYSYKIEATKKGGYWKRWLCWGWWVSYDAYIPCIKAEVSGSSGNDISNFNFFMPKCNGAGGNDSDSGSTYEKNNSVDISLMSRKWKSEYKFYLSPRNPGEKICNYNLQSIGINGNPCWDGNYKWAEIDRVNNRLSINVVLRSYWWCRIYFNWNYSLMTNSASSKLMPSTEKFSAPPLMQEKKTVNPVVKLGLNYSAGVLRTGNNLMAAAPQSPKPAIMIKDVEDDLTTAEMTLRFDPNKVKIEDIEAPVLPDPGLEVLIDKSIDNETGVVKIKVMVVEKDLLKGTVTETAGMDTISAQGAPAFYSSPMLASAPMNDSYGTDTPSSFEDVENIAPIANLIIRRAGNSLSGQGGQTMAPSLDNSEDIFSSITMSEVELKNSKGELISAVIVNKSQPVSNLNEVYCYPNPTKSGQIIFANLTQQAKIRIFNIAGELVYDKECVPIINRKWAWKCVNNNNDKLAGGIYIYVLTDVQTGGEKRGKLGILK